MKKLNLFVLVSVTLVSLCMMRTAVAETKTTIKDTPVVSAASSNENSWDKKKAIGINGVGYYEINTDWESLYFGFAEDNINTAGLGFSGFFEVGASEKISIEISLGYSRLLSASEQRDTINESYFLADLLAHYHFYNKGPWDVFGIGGVGVNVSDTSAAPMVDLGIGSYYKMAEGFYLKTEVMAKSAIILNRAEAHIGIAYLF